MASGRTRRQFLLTAAGVWSARWPWGVGSRHGGRPVPDGSHHTGERRGARRRCGRPERRTGNSPGTEVLFARTGRPDGTAARTVTADCLSVCVSEWDKAGILYGKTARECTRECTREQVARETWAQLKAALNGTGGTVLTPICTRGSSIPRSPASVARNRAAVSNSSSIPSAPSTTGRPGPQLLPRRRLRADRRRPRHHGRRRRVGTPGSQRAARRGPLEGRTLPHLAPVPVSGDGSPQARRRGPLPARPAEHLRRGVNPSDQITDSARSRASALHQTSRPHLG